MGVFRTSFSAFWNRRTICTSRSTFSNRQRSSYDVDATMSEYRRRTERAAQTAAATSETFYRMILPPPNVTGNLHLGHALTVTIEDAMCRQQRLRAKNAIWYPGFDHAGIATQVVVERHLWNERRLRRSQLSREEFLEACENWKQSRIEEMCNQLQLLGATLDWKSMYYTMDSRFKKAVTVAFCRLHSMGLIFNDYRMINWCPKLRSVISDQEVDIIDVGESISLNFPSDGFEHRKLKVGVMHKLRYKLVDSDEFLEVATSRPETAFADVALVVNPSDGRYAQYIGMVVRHPLIAKKLLPVISDDKVKPEKGTGILKLTPAHDFTDFEIARNHISQLGVEVFKNVCIDESACLINAGDLTGINRFDARDKVIELLIANGNYGGESYYNTQQIHVCNRTGDVVEPMLKRQWFLDCRTMHANALNALRNSELTVTPKFMQAELVKWLSNEEPWCLSRQLDWGHQVPAYRMDPDDQWIVADDPHELSDDAQNSSNLAAFTRDVDVLDTWFCSALIPIVLAGWPDKPVNNIPLSVLETGHDIVGFWVARMIAVCQTLTGVLPFQKVALHGLIRDSEGRKMSKSLGNAIDPLDIIHGITLDDMLQRLNDSALPNSEKKSSAASIRDNFPNGVRKFGPDALRFALLRHNCGALDVNIDICQKADEGLRFCNKLWNLCNYIEELREKLAPATQKFVDSDQIEDRWIKSRVQSMLLAVSEGIENSSPHLALDAVKNFFWADLCDVYIESTKKALWKNDIVRLTQVDALLDDVVKKALLQLSVFMPFISEHLFDREFKLGDSAIDISLEAGMSLAVAIVSAIRSLRVEFGLSNKIVLTVSIEAKISEFYALIGNLCNVKIVDEQREMRSGMPYPVIGYPNQIKVALEEDQTGILVNKLKSRLKSAEKRREKFRLKSCNYDRIASKEMNKDKIERIEKKSFQAQRVVDGMNEEIKRLKSLLQSVAEH